ncbi:hypothetical protein E4V01_22305 [Methylorubrum sp. Q1]|nr:hypothetical protein E4V01_22305 [Methylorubrum sp. Q1]
MKLRALLFALSSGNAPTAKSSKLGFERLSPEQQRHRFIKAAWEAGAGGNEADFDAASKRIARPNKAAPTCEPGQLDHSGGRSNLADTHHLSTTAQVGSVFSGRGQIQEAHWAWFNPRKPLLQPRAPSIGPPQPSAAAKARPRRSRHRTACSG